ncbi:hypothetical protein ATY79_26575 [Rhizobium sp. R693]|nr:hypothetical protein ATY79_26575 [Rhizobium sp. R693]
MRRKFRGLAKVRGEAFGRKLRFREATLAVAMVASRLRAIRRGMVRALPMGRAPLVSLVSTGLDIGFAPE